MSVQNPIPAPPVTPTRRGLVNAARTPDGAERWQPGVSYVAESGIGDGGGFDPCESVELPATNRPTSVLADAWGIYLGETCSTFNDVPVMGARLERRLRAQTTHFLEETFSTLIMQDGSDFTADHPNRPLYDPLALQPVGTDAVGVTTGVRELIEGLASQIGSAQGMIHAPSWVAPFLDFYGLVYVDGNQVRLRLTDHIVVLATGYSGASPNGVVTDGVAWLYATSPVEVRLGEIEITGLEGAEFARDTNDVNVRAMRSVIAHWDLEGHVAVPVCLPDPGPDCPAVSS